MEPPIVKGNPVRICDEQESAGGPARSVSVVICTRDRPEHLDRCLASVSRLDYPKFDILVVDNAPTNAATADVCRRWGTRYVVEPTPGLSRARNRGARECTSELIAYIDDDATATADWLSALVFEFADSMVMAVAGRILPPHDREFTPAPSSESTGCDSKRVLDSGSDSWFEISNFGGIGIGANMAFRRRAFSIWPGFDERLGRGAVLFSGEEDYAFFSLIKRGYRVVYAPAARVFHRHPDSCADDPQQQSNLWMGSTAYALFLFSQEPHYRRAVLNFLLTGAADVPRPWRALAPCGRSGLDRRWRKAAAAARGLLLFARWRLSSSVLWQTNELTAPN